MYTNMHWNFFSGIYKILILSTFSVLKEFRIIWNLLAENSLKIILSNSNFKKNILMIILIVHNSVAIFSTYLLFLCLLFKPKNKYNKTTVKIFLIWTEENSIMKKYFRCLLSYYLIWLSDHSFNTTSIQFISALSESCFSFNACIKLSWVVEVVFSFQYLGYSSCPLDLEQAYLRVA